MVPAQGAGLFAVLKKKNPAPEWTDYTTPFTLLVAILSAQTTIKTSTSAPRLFRRP